MKNLSVVGLGYIGLPTAILAAQHGYKVYGFDVNQEKISKIKSGDPTIIEPKIVSRLNEVIKNKNFFVDIELKEADCFLIAVPTPLMNDKKEPDLSYVFSACQTISSVLKPGNLIILESTVPVGTTFCISKFLEKKSGLKLGVDFFVAYCPERVLPGRIFEELVSNERVIGGICQESSHLANKFYSKFVKGKLYLTDDRTAEMVKLVENGSRDVQIAFANQVADMCYKAKIDPFRVIEFANKHPRVNILNPGCGVGGHCLAVDPWFLVRGFKRDSNLLKISRSINDERPFKVVNYVIKQVEKLKKKGIEKPKILVLGLTFKPDVDDLRNSPALKICLELNKKTELFEMGVCEPNLVSDRIIKLGFSNVKELVDGVKWADIILPLVKHKDFFGIKYFNLKDKLVVDVCGLFYNSIEFFIQGAIFDKNENYDRDKLFYSKDIGGY
ncbi:nucleotide sugar dehydrogenase [Candidatus Babeliales bacterium]|nr:nucleotide sugar dehydrogenase [Candidatus Babeliales bacterium]